MRLSRRSFLKTSAITFSAAALSNELLSSVANASTTSTDYSIEKKVYMNCRMCAQYCPMVAYTDGNRVLRIEANPNTPYPAVCGRGRAAISALYNPDRVKTPLIRVGERGSGEFRSATWDEALDVVGKKMKELRDNNEAHSVAYFPRFAAAPVLDDAMFNLYGTENIFGYGDSCFGSTNQFGLGSILGGGEEPRLGNAAVMGDYENSKLAVLIGRNPVGGLVAFPWGAMFGRGRKNGMKVAVIDPRMPAGAGETDADWLPVIPGTDVALLNALANEIFKNKYYDEAFLKEQTNADMLVYVDNLQPVSIIDEFEEPDYLVFDSTKNAIVMKSEASEPSLLGEFEYQNKKVKTALQMLMDSCKDYTPEVAEKVCGVSATQIKKLASDLNVAKPACFLERGYRSTRYFNSLHEKRLISLINGLLGVYGAKGGLIYGRNVRMDTPFDYAEQAEPTVTGYYIDNVKGFELAHPTEMRRLFPKAVKEGLPYKLKVAFFNGQNLVGGGAGAEEAIEALKQMELVVSISPFWNETMMYSDVIIPDCTFMERDEPINTTYKATFPVMSVHNKAIEPLYDSKSGYWTIIELAKRIFPANEFEEYFGDFVRGGVPYIVQYQLENINGMNANDKATFSIDKLFNNGVWCGTPAKLAPSNKGTRTDTIEVYSTFMSEWNKKLLSEDRKKEAEYFTPLITWVPPYWKSLKETLGKDEFVAITGFHPLGSFTGGQTRNNVLISNVSDMLNLDAVFINNAKGKALGLKSGDIIEIFNIEKPHLVTKSKVELCEMVEPNSMFSYFGIGAGYYNEYTKKLSWAAKTGFNPNHISNLSYMPVEASAPSQDFIVQIRRAK